MGNRTDSCVIYARRSSAPPTWCDHVAGLPCALVIHVERIQVAHAHISMDRRHGPRRSELQTVTVDEARARLGLINPPADQRCGGLSTCERLGHHGAAGTAAAALPLQTSAGPAEVWKRLTWEGAATAARFKGLIMATRAQYTSAAKTFIRFGMDEAIMDQ